MTPHPLGGSPAPGPPRRSLLRAVAAGGLLVLVPLAALGAVVNPWASLVLGAIFATSAGLITFALHRDPPDGRPPRAHPGVAACWAALLPAAVGGGVVIGPAVVLPAAVLLVLAALAAAVRSGRRRPAAACGEHPERPAPVNDGSLSELLQRLPIDVLCLEWRCTSESEAFPDGNTVAREHLRLLLLAELRRRDLPGTLRWLAEAPGSPPDQYVRDLRDRAA